MIPAYALFVSDLFRVAVSCVALNPQLFYLDLDKVDQPYKPIGFGAQKPYYVFQRIYGKVFGLKSSFFDFLVV